MRERQEVHGVGAFRLYRHGASGEDMQNSNSRKKAKEHKCARIRRGVDTLQEGHVGNVVEIYAVLENDTEAFAIQADGENGGGEA